MRKGSSSPKYRRQKRARHADLAFVDLGGKRVYLGEYGSRQSRRDYDRRIQEWMAGQHSPRIDESSLSIVELIERYHHFAAEYYRKPDGSTSSELNNIRLALRPVRELYADQLAVDFGPRALKAVRERMIEMRHCRNQINKNIRRITRMFKWAVAEDTRISCGTMRRHTCGRSLASRWRGSSSGIGRRRLRRSTPSWTGRRQ